MGNELKEICERLYGSKYGKEEVRYEVIAAAKMDNGWNLTIQIAAPLKGVDVEVAENADK